MIPQDASRRRARAHCAQIMERKKLADVDWKRQGAFTLFGFAYLVRFARCRQHAR